MVKRVGLVDKLRVTADGTGVVGHAGSALLAGTADRVGLTRALSDAMAPARQRASAHDPGVVLRDLVVMLSAQTAATAWPTWARCATSSACSVAWRRTRLRFG